MAMNSLHDLFVDELRDMYNMERQILDALPLMEKAASSPALKSAFEFHLEQTRGQAQRLEQIFQELGVSPTGQVCEGMQGIIIEGSELMKQNAPAEVLDAGLIAAAQKVEHYEIASYGSARTWARQMGQHHFADLLQQTLDEEEATDHKLTDIAEGLVNAQAAAGR